MNRADLISKKGSMKQNDFIGRMGNRSRRDLRGRQMTRFTNYYPQSQMKGRKR